MADATLTRHGNVAVITLGNPPVNGLGAAIRQNLDRCLTECLDDREVHAVVLRGAGSMFSAGADIREFNTPAMSAEPLLPALCNRIELASKPVVAALHGTAAGGGLELALACHYRIAAPGTRVALPEVKLGIVPGAGGTQRLPRLIGAAAALDMIVTGDFVPAERALAMGIVDRLAENDLVRDAVAFASNLKDPRATRVGTRHMEGARSDPALFERYRARTAKRSRGATAPMACIDCVEAAVEKPFEEGLAFERATFRRCVESAQSKALRYAFFAERAAAKIEGLPATVKPIELRSAGVIGCGTMGRGIAMAFANAGLPVTIIEGDAARLDEGLGSIRQTYDDAVSRGRLNAEEREGRLGLIGGATGMRGLAGCDVVIEAVFEDLELKRQVFRELDRVAAPHAILASNTSTLDIDRIADATKRPEQVAGMHFFSPANVMTLLENVRGARTGSETIATVMALAKRLGKVGVLVGNCDGFVGNRMLYRYLAQADRLLEEGALPLEIDKAILDFGFPMGPFAMQDLAGLDVGYRVRQERAKRNPGVEAPRAIADRLCEMRRFGQKTGAGWHRYAAGSRTPERDPLVEGLILERSRELGLERRDMRPDEIVARCLYPVVNEAAFILEEGIAARESDIDVIWMHGYGFPRHKGGPLFYADEIGLEHVLAVVRRLEGVEAAPLLLDLVASGRRFRDLGRARLKADSA